MRQALFGLEAMSLPVLEMKLSDRGFTLSELLLAAAILVFVLAGLLALFINCLILNEANRNLTTATSHAQYVMEEIKNTTFTSTIISIKSKINDDRDWDWNTATIGSKGLVALSNESIDTSASGTDPLDVTVTVIWKDRNARDRNIGLHSLFTNY